MTVITLLIMCCYYYYIAHAQPAGVRLARSVNNPPKRLGKHYFDFFMVDFNEVGSVRCCFVLYYFINQLLLINQLLTLGRVWILWKILRDPIK